MISVIIPTYKRTQSVVECLKGLQKQIMLPHEVIVVVRDEDKETLDTLKKSDFSPLVVKLELVHEPGMVAALNKGLIRSEGEIIAITDDDTIPQKQWLYYINDCFESNKHVGGVGGRDWVYINGKLVEGIGKKVGKVKWFGKVVGNHHLGTKFHEVDVLKGANMSFRKTAINHIRFDHRLKGSGAQVHNDLAFSLEVKKAGWTLIYDPRVAVDHYPAQRFDEDKRNSFNAVAQFNAVFNETFTLKNYLGPFKRVIYFIWAFLVGTSSAPGILQVFRLLITLKNNNLVEKYIATQRGRLNGMVSR
ncbi:glycosyltransferase family 2 protein [Paenibacillus daejeonensis]|uniref:glycosyltransferase family 2 protein n=1 Tax=Paenibacillus daejeonensis TaxID=135193 RepID=UPI0003804773|nr:glycosyltransferase family 2 protein [Paenibacillus daejeonensis]